MHTIVKNLRKIKEDYMKSPKSIKAISGVGAIAIATVIFMILSGCSYGPSADFVKKMQERADDHFPKYKYFIDRSSNEELEVIHDELNAGDLKGASPENIEAIKRSMKRALDAWKYEIDENVKLLKGDK